MANNQPKTQWEKRVDVVNFLYSQLIKHEPYKIAISQAVNDFKLDANQLKIVEYYLENTKEIVSKISHLTSDSWTFERLNMVDQAILIEAYSEYMTLQTEKKILIDQSIITAKHYSGEDNYKYINAILDKLL